MTPLTYRQSRQGVMETNAFAATPEFCGSEPFWDIGDGAGDGTTHTTLSDKTTHKAE
jgi:hypothetical protein